MPRSFDFSVDTPARVEQIYYAFASRDYWRARLAAFDGSGRLEEFTVDADGRVTAVLANDLRPDGLPGPFARFFPRQWRVEQTETWSPVRDGIVRGKIVTASHGAPGSGSGTTLVAPAPDGSRFKCKATVEFKIPLLGGQIESIIGRSLVQNTSVLQQFTADWIKENA